jgi:predicted CoA-substrate-specific enzyme activase
MFAIGIDAGSLTTKVVAWDGTRVLAAVTKPSGEDSAATARQALDEVLGKLGTGMEGVFVVATGAGAKSIGFAQQQKAITTCLARGIRQVLPSARMVIDIGAESSTVLKVNERGKLTDWANHDKCAAGTGLFIQQMAKLMQVSLNEMAQMSLDATGKADISGTCAVFAESEVISHVHRVPPTPRADIVAGIYASTVSRLMAMAKRVGVQKDVAVTGGVALNVGLVKLLEGELGYAALVPPMPQSVAALGAAVLAQENISAGAAKS